MPNDGVPRPFSLSPLLSSLLLRFPPFREAFNEREDPNYSGPGKDCAAHFWTFPWCMEMWKNHPAVLVVDNTFKVNRFNMPLLNTTGVTSTHANLDVAFGREDEEDRFFLAYESPKGPTDRPQDLEPRRFFSSDLCRGFKEILAWSSTTAQHFSIS